MLSGYSKQAVDGSIPNRLYNGLPPNSGVHLPTSTLGRGALPGMAPTENDYQESLSYSPGLVETSGALSQVQVFNPAEGVSVQNKMTAKTNAAGNILLKRLLG